MERAPGAGVALALPYEYFPKRYKESRSRGLEGCEEVAEFIIQVVRAGDRSRDFRAEQPAETAAEAVDRNLDRSFRGADG
jgi:hypothetical protein